MQKWMNEGFPGGLVVKSLPANSGAMGLTCDPGRSHIPRSNWAHVLQPPKSMDTEPVLCNKGSHHTGKPAHPTEKRRWLATAREKPTQQQRPSTAINK